MDFLFFFLSSPQDCATMQFCANKLDKKDFFGRSDPFMMFYRSNEDGTWVYSLSLSLSHSLSLIHSTLSDREACTRNVQVFFLSKQVKKIGLGLRNVFENCSSQ